MEGFPNLVRALMEHFDVDQKQLAERLDLNQSSVSRWLNKGSEPRVREYLRVMGAAEDAGLIPRGGRFGSAMVMGRIGAGAEIRPDVEQVPADGFYEVEVAFPLPDGAIAFEVDGDAMYPRYDSGDVVICWKEGADLETVIGCEAAVRLEDGRRLLKRVERGTEPETVNLESHNLPPIRNVKLQWASQVHSVVRAGQWSKRTRRI